jgi:broad specificity phosphatase PhoE
MSAAWREIDFGAWDGLTDAQIVEQFKGQLGFLTDPERYSPPNGEPLAHMQQRVIDALATITHSDDFPAGDVMIISHGGPLRILLCNLLGMPIQRQWQLRLDHGSLSAIDLLPVHESSVPYAILALLNFQRPAYADHSAKSPLSAATSGQWQEEGTL